MARALWKSPHYKGKARDGERFTVDVTLSISSGLDPNAGLLAHLIPFMRDRGLTRVLDFGAGALRHTLPLLDAGFEVTAVEFEEAYGRPKAKANLEKARASAGFTRLIWPRQFLTSRERYDVALLMFVLQIVPRPGERRRILDEIGRRLDRAGPRRLYYASRYEKTSNFSDGDRYQDGWLRGRNQSHQTFYTQWNAAETNAMLKKQKFERAGTYVGASQGYIFVFEPGL